jgi:hypothetical protein
MPALATLPFLCYLQASCSSWLNHLDRSFRQDETQNCVSRSQSMKRLVIRSMIVAALLLPVAIVFAGVNIYNHIDDACAQWGAADMVIDFMRDHDGEWPPDWNALLPSFVRNNGRVSGWSYAKFQSHVFIDFTSDSKTLRHRSIESNSIPFDVIHAKSVWGSQFDDGPNGMLYRFFRDGDCSGS